MRLFLFIFCSAVVGWVNANPLNHYQIIGSHNSYKQVLNQEVKVALTARDPQFVSKIDYGHQAITSQLNSGIRHLEIDVLKDPNGNLYSAPWAGNVVKSPLFNHQQQQQLNTPGFKVLHIPDVDVQTHCVLFSTCLTQLKTWSDANPNHFVVIVLVNVKESRSSIVAGEPVLTFEKKDYTALDRVIKTTLQHRLFTPDQLRQAPLTLQESVLKNGWPDASQLKQKFIFLFDGKPAQTALYKQNRPSLRNASMFAHYPQHMPEAAFMIVNNPVSHSSHIRSLITQGFMVRTRADADLSATNAQRKIQFDAAKLSGAHVISTDFIPGSPQQARFNYVVQFANKQLIRTTANF